MSDFPPDNFWMDGKDCLLETLPDLYVLEFILMNKDARIGYDEIFHLLSEDRQTYLDDLIARHPMVKAKQFIDPQEVTDYIQRKDTTSGIHVPMTPRLRKLKKQREES